MTLTRGTPCIYFLTKSPLNVLLFIKSEHCFRDSVRVRSSCRRLLNLLYVWYFKCRAEIIYFVRIQLFCNLVLHLQVSVSWPFQRAFFVNAGNHTTIATVSYLRTPKSSERPLREPQISQNMFLILFLIFSRVLVVLGVQKTHSEF